MKIRFTLNGREVTFEGAPNERAQKFLQRNGIPSVRNSDDGFGFAGSDTILLDGKIVGANILLAPQLEGRDVKTIESLHTGRNISIVEQAMLETGCVQSGYNSPAAALMIADLLDRNPQPDREAVKDALSGLFNRATGYEQFFDAVALAAARRKDPDYQPTEKIPSFGADYTIVGKPSPKKGFRPHGGGGRRSSSRTGSSRGPVF